jgi:hypothetical protein
MYINDINRLNFILQNCGNIKVGNRKFADEDFLMYLISLTTELERQCRSLKLLCI